MIQDVKELKKALGDPWTKLQKKQAATCISPVDDKVEQSNRLAVFGLVRGKCQETETQISRILGY